MEDFPIDKIQISGATLASLLHRSSAAAGDIHGYLFGRAAVSTPNILSDHSTAAAVSSILTATITSFLAIPSHLSLPPPASLTDSGVLLGWFSARRKTPLRPSLKDSSMTSSLVSSPSLKFTPQYSDLEFSPSLLLLITTPFQDQIIHTHEYKAFQYRGSRFEAKSLSIVNIGPSFRSQYDSFSPSVQLPMIDLGKNRMEENEDYRQSLASQKKRLSDQTQLTKCTEGFDVADLGRLIHSEAADTLTIEDLYDKMLAKIDSLSRMVEQTNARVLEQENRNLKQRCKVAGLD